MPMRKIQQFYHKEVLKQSLILKEKRISLIKEIVQNVYAHTLTETS